MQNNKQNEISPLSLIKQKEKELRHKIISNKIRDETVSLKIALH